MIRKINNIYRKIIASCCKVSLWVIHDPGVRKLHLRGTYGEAVPNQNDFFFAHYIDIGYKENVHLLNPIVRKNDPSLVVLFSNKETIYDDFLFWVRTRDLRWAIKRYVYKSGYNLYALVRQMLEGYFKCLERNSFVTGYMFCQCVRDDYTVYVRAVNYIDLFKEYRVENVEMAIEVFKRKGFYNICLEEPIIRSFFLFPAITFNLWKKLNSCNL